MTINATIDLSVLIYWLKSREPSAGIKADCLGLDLGLDMLTEAIDGLDLETVDFLMSEIGKADLEITRQLANLLEEPLQRDGWICYEWHGHVQAPRKFSLAGEITRGARNCRPSGKHEEKSMKGNFNIYDCNPVDTATGCSSIEIPHVQKMLAQLTAAKREKERNMDCE